MDVQCFAPIPGTAVAAAPGLLTDEQLIYEARGRSDRREADVFLNELFRRYENRMVAWCIYFTRENDWAYDLAQDVFLKALRHLDTFRSESKVATWLYAIARNHCIAFLRARPRQMVSINNEISETVGDARALRAYRAIETDQLRTYLRGAISTALDPLEAQVIRMHYMQGLSVQAITDRLKLSNPTGAKAYLLKARRKLGWALRTRGARCVPRTSYAASRRS